MMHLRVNGRRLARAGAALLVTALAVATSGAQTEPEPLTLRIQDAVGTPGGIVSVVLRTYASRPIGQGQVCLSAEPRDIVNPGGLGVLQSFENAIVWSASGDAATEVTADLAGDPQVILLQFSSPSATVNSTDGPLAALYFTLSEAAVPGETYELVLDVANTSLDDEHGNPIVVDGRLGELVVRGPADPYEVSVDVGQARPGDPVTFSVQTLEPFAVARGRVALSYDPAIAVSRPAVRMDPRHGLAGFLVDTSVPGRVVVEFESPNAALNALPGDLIELTFVTSEAMTDGAVAPIVFDPASTWFEGEDGELLPITLEDDELVFVGSPREGGARHVETFGRRIDARRVEISQ